MSSCSKLQGWPGLCVGLRPSSLCLRMGSWLHVGWPSRARCLGKALRGMRAGAIGGRLCLSWPSSSTLRSVAHHHAPDAAAQAMPVPRRLSRPSSSELCGRITMFLTQLLPLLDRSGLNVQGAFNDSHSTPVEEVPEVRALTGSQRHHHQGYWLSYKCLQGQLA